MTDDAVGTAEAGIVVLGVAVPIDVGEEGLAAWWRNELKQILAGAAQKGPEVQPHEAGVGLGGGDVAAIASTRDASGDR